MNDVENKKPTGDLTKPTLDSTEKQNPDNLPIQKLNGQVKDALDKEEKGTSLKQQAQDIKDGKNLESDRSGE